MNSKTVSTIKLILLVSIVKISQSLYSKDYKKCRLFKSSPGKLIS